MIFYFGMKKILKYNYRLLIKDYYNLPRWYFRDVISALKCGCSKLSLNNCSILSLCCSTSDGRRRIVILINLAGS